MFFYLFSESHQVLLVDLNIFIFVVSKNGKSELLNFSKEEKNAKLMAHVCNAIEISAE